MLVFDALVFGMTLYKSLALVRSSPEINLLTVLLRDGKPSLFALLDVPAFCRILKLNMMFYLVPPGAIYFACVSALLGSMNG